MANGAYGEKDTPVVSNSGAYGENDRPVGSSEPGSLLKDLGQSLKSGVEQLPGMVTGLADIPTALAFNARPFSKAADAIGEATGFKPGKWAKEVDHSQAYKDQQAEVAKPWAPVEEAIADPAKSKMDAAKALWTAAPELAATYLKNPGYTANQVVESLPAMFAGGAISQGLKAIGRVASVAENVAAGTAARAAIPGLLERKLGINATSEVAGGIGEGAVQTGQQMDGYQGDDARKAALASLGSGAGDALIAMGAGRLAHAGGFETANTAMAKAGSGAPGTGLALGKRVAGGMLTEGIMQELPQSAQEQVWQNWQEGKPLMEGVLRQGVEGALSGAVMGAGANVAAGKYTAPTDPAATPPGTAPAQPLLDYNNVIIPEVPRADGQEEIPIVGPLSAAVVSSGLTPTNANRVGTLLRNYATRQDAQDALDQREDGARMDIIPHPRGKSGFAVVPKDQSALAKMDLEDAKRKATTPTPAQDEAGVLALAGEDAQAELQMPQSQPVAEMPARTKMGARMTEAARLAAVQRNAAVQDEESAQNIAKPPGVTSVPKADQAQQTKPSPQAEADSARVAQGTPTPTFNAQPTTLGTQTNAVAGPGFTASNRDQWFTPLSKRNVQNTPAAEQSKQNTVSSESTVEQTGKAPEIVGSDAATTDKLPPAGTGAAVQADGVKADIEEQIADLEYQANKFFKNGTEYLGRDFEPEYSALKNKLEGGMPQEEYAKELTVLMDEHAKAREAYFAPNAKVNAEHAAMLAGLKFDPVSTQEEAFNRNRDQAVFDLPDDKLKQLGAILGVKQSKNQSRIAFVERITERPGSDVRSAYLTVAQPTQPVTGEGAGVAKPADTRLVPVSTRIEQSQPPALANTAQPAIESVAEAGPVGRNNVPLSEGGKPYKTNRAAKEAKKLQPMMRVITVDGGWALGPKTEAQIKAQEKAAARLARGTVGNAGVPMSAHELIASEGGLNKVHRNDLGVEGNPRIGSKFLYAGTGGISIERATERLKEEGYLPPEANHTQAFDLIRKSLKTPQYTPDGFEAMARAQEAVSYEDHLAQQQEAAQNEEFDDPFEPMLDGDFVADDFDVPGYDEASDPIKLEVNALLALADDAGINEDAREAIKEDAHYATLDQSEQAFYESYRNALKDAIAASNRVGSADSGEAGNAQGSQEGLTAPTREEVLAKQEQAEQAAKDKDIADRKADKLAREEDERKRIAKASEAAAGTFELGGNALDNLTGQGSMFARGPWRSALRDGLSNINAKALSPEMWADGIKGLINKGTAKADEVEWSGITDWLKLQTGKVTKEQVMAYLDGNGVQMQEVVMGGEKPQPESELSASDIGVKENEYDWTLSTPSGASVGVGRYTVTTEQEARAYGVRYFNGQIRERNRERAQRGDGTKYSQYQLPGGSNYREVLLTLPVKTVASNFTIPEHAAWVEDDGDFKLVQNDAQGNYKHDLTNWRKSKELAIAEVARANGLAETKNANYKSPHWDQTNVLAHVRLNDRVDSDGKRVLFVEELQSDWGQDGKKKGFGEKPAWHVIGSDGSIIFATNDKTVADRELAQNAGATLRETKGKSDVPIAPFVNKTEGWLNLALKRIITMAVEGGYDRVAFVNGEQSADRYDLSKSVSDIQYTKEANGKYYIVVGGPRGGVHSGEHTASELEDYVGKELAQRIVDRADDSMKELTGLDLKVGGEGMRTFYDRIVPNTTNALLKKLGGGKMETVELQLPGQQAGERDRASGTTIGPDGTAGKNFDASGFTLTPAMIEKASEGLPLFAREALRRSSTPRLFMPITEVQRAVDQMTAKWKDGPRVKVVATPEELPIDAPMDARGLIHNGTVYIVAANHRDRDGVARTLGHEAVGHYGLWKMLGEDGTRQFQAQLQLALKSGNVPLNKIAATVRGLYVDQNGKFNLSPRQEANEIAAFAVESAIDADGNFKPGFGFFKAVWAKVAAFLRDLGITVQFTNAELQGMLVSSMRGLETGKRLDGGGHSLVAAALGSGGNSNVLRKFGKQIVSFREVQDGGPQNWQMGASTGNAGPDARGDGKGEGLSRFVANNAFARSSIVGSTNDYSPDMLKVMDKLGWQVEVPTLKERAQALWKDAGKKMAQGIADQFAPVKDLDGRAYGLLRLAKGASGAFETLLKGGMLKLSDGVYDFDEGQKGGVIDKLLMPLQGEHHNFFRWVAAQRANQLKQVGKENLFDQSDIDTINKWANTTDAKFDYTIQHGVRKGQTTRNRAEMYRDSNITFSEFNKNVLDMAEQSGLIDGATRHLWENEFYVPFYRVSDDADGGVRGMNIKGAAVRQQAFKTLKGGKQKLNADLLENTLMNWAHLLDASAKNRAAKATIEAAEKMGVAMGGNQSALASMGSTVGNKNGVVWFMDGGQKRYSLIDNQGDGPYIMTALSSLEYAGMRNPVMNAMGAMKHALTVGVTASPFFKVRNLIRDSVQVVGTGPISYNVGKNLAEGWKLTDPKSDAYFQLLAGGGTIHFGTMTEGSEAKRVQALVESGVNGSTILDSDHKLKAFYRKFIEPGITAYNELGNRGEAVNRAALYNQLRKQGIGHAEASLQARDLMDFSMQGSWTIIRFLTQVVPFMNARIQGLYKLGKAAKEDPARFSLVLGATAMASLSLLAAYGDDDDWKKRTDSDRNNFWWFKVGGTAFRIPKPFEIGAIGTLAERGFELAFDKEMDSKRFGSQVLALLSDQLSMNPVPQAVKPILDVYANIDSFSGTPIENMAQQKLKSEYRFNDKTTMAARGTSTALNAVTGLIGKEAYSPVDIDHMLRGYFGWLGTMVVSAGDYLARPATGQPDQAREDYLKKLTGNMASDLRDAPSRYVNQMYTQAKTNMEAYDTWRALMKEQKPEEAKEFFAGNKQAIVDYRRTEAAKKSETLFNNMMRMVERNRELDPDQKRERIRVIQAQKEAVAKRAVLTP